MNKINVVVLEDDQFFQIKLESMLYGTEFQIIKMFENPKNLENDLNTISVDLILSDVYIGKKPEGGDLIKRLSEKNMPIICITVSQEDKIYQELGQLVSGYLVKPFHKITLLSIMREAIKEHKKNQLFDFYR
jgi:response regulator of citrate/malate metabolism